MQKILKIILLGFIICLSSACVSQDPLIYGVPESQWINLTPEQQADIIQTYHQHHAANSEDYLIPKKRLFK